MGGSAFPDLNVPRLSPTQYVQLREQYISILSTFFHDVTFPRPAPEKADYGDVDIYVCRPKQEFDVATMQNALQEALGATARRGHGHTNSFAVPMNEIDGGHAQIDVHVCSPGYLDWELFKSGDGDLAQILGVLNRHLGITMTDKGIHVRVEELESRNRPLSMILLTKDPERAMLFLGLHVDKWRQGFETEVEIFAWCAAGKYYRAPSRDLENANDRVRMRKRPMFSRFIDQWVPEHPDMWQTEESSRERVLQDALVQFGVQCQYEDRIDHWKADVAQRKLTDAIQEHISIGKLGQRIVMRGVKRWVTRQENEFRTQPDLAPQSNDDAPPNPEWFADLKDEDMPKVIAWLQANHTTIRDKETQFGEKRKNGMHE